MNDRWHDIDRVTATLDPVVANLPLPRIAPRDESEPTAQRYKLLSADDLHALPDLVWRVRGVLPTTGLAAFYGPSGCAKSFLVLDLGAAIAEGKDWFGYRVEKAPVVYVVLEGEGGIKQRAWAWELRHGRSLPANFNVVMQPFNLAEPCDVLDLASVVPKGAVVILDTLNRAAPTADENASRDMGMILEAAKELQAMTNSLVILVHHTGKDPTKGLRGHSSLIAALDASIEVAGVGNQAPRTWTIAKVKDGEGGVAHPFRLAVETLGTNVHGDAITSCVIAQTGSTQVAPAKIRLPGGGNQRLVMDGLTQLFDTGTTGKPGVPPESAAIALGAAIAAGAAKLNNCPRDKRNSRSHEAIAGLVRRGILGLNGGWLWRVL